MLHIINNILDPLVDYIKDDPVRPEISREFRVGKYTEIIALLNQGIPEAFVCAAYRDFVPATCEELFVTPENPSIAVFYTIWSYKAGAGRTLIETVRKELSTHHPEIARFVTLSPKTELAKRFHLKNGAVIYRDNPETVNYEYA
jgi:hypothetical protein